MTRKSKARWLSIVLVCLLIMNCMPTFVAAEVDPSGNIIFSDPDLLVSLLNVGYPRVDTNYDNKISKTEAENVLFLSISCNTVDSLDGLQHFSNLRDLYIYSYAGSDLAPLKDLTRLTNLSVEYCQNLLSLADFSNLPNFQSMYINNCPNLQDISGLQNASLSGLRIANSPLLSDFSPLQTLTSMISLDLRSCWRLTDIGFARNMPNLQNLNLEYGSIRDISPLSNLTSLNSLVLSNNQITDISVLERLTSLSNLDLGKNNISDLQVFSNMVSPAIQTLILSGNPIDSIVPLLDLSNLIELGLYVNPEVLNMSRDSESMQVIRQLADRSVKLYFSSVSYQSYIKDQTLQTIRFNGETSGDPNLAAPIEGFAAALNLEFMNEATGVIEYKADFRDYGWTYWRSQKILGAPGDVIEGLSFRLTNFAALDYDIYYRTYVQNYGWLDWASNGQEAGSFGYGYPIIAFEIQLASKGSTPPGATNAHYLVNPDITYYTVHYDSQGGSDVAPVQVESGTRLSAPPQPTLAGYTFVGWFKETGCVTEWNFGSETVTAATILYAKWQKNPDFTSRPNGDGTVSISGYAGSSLNVIIPADLGGMRITGIDAGTFTSRPNIQSVEIPEHVSTLDFMSVFDICKDLQAINVSSANQVFSSSNGVLLSKTMTELYYSPKGFAGAYVIPASVTMVDDGAFMNCDKLTSLSIPANCEFGWYMLPGCSSLAAYYVDAANPHYLAIEDVLFRKDGKTLLQYPASKAAEYKVPEGVLYIADTAFSDSPVLKKVTLPSTVQEISSQAFLRCALLEEVEIQSSSFLSYGEIAKDCPRLSKAVLYCQTVSDPAALFVNVASSFQIEYMNWLTIDPNDLASPPMKVGYPRNSYCQPEAPSRIGYAFGGWFTDIACTTAWNGQVDQDRTIYAKWIPCMTYQDFEYLINENQTITIHRYTGTAAIVDIPEDIDEKAVTHVVYGAFLENVSVVQINVPATCTDFTVYDPGDGPPNLAAINFAPGHPRYTSFEGIVLCSLGGSRADEYCIVHVPRAKAGDLVIPDYITEARDGAFTNCRFLTSITLPATYKIIDGQTIAFATVQCPALVNVYVATGNADYVGIDGVAYTKRESIRVNDAYSVYEGQILQAYPDGRYGAYVIPDGTTAIGIGFRFDRRLTDVTIPASVTAIDDEAFLGCSGLRHVYLYGNAYPNQALIFNADLPNVSIHYMNKVGLNLNYDGAPAGGLLDAGRNMLLTSPQEPKRLGFVFNGWFRDSACTDDWNFSSDRVTADMILYANWVPAQATGISIKTYPGKLIYSYGESLNLNGGILSLTDENGDTFDVMMNASGVSVSGYEGTVIGQQVLTVSYLGLSTQFIVEVLPPPNQPVTQISVSGLGGATKVALNKTLQMVASIAPAYATNKTVQWSVKRGTGTATISSSGILTGTKAGTVTVTASATDGSSVQGSLVVMVMVPVTGITVTGANSASSVEVDKTLQMTATILPANATYKTVTWSVRPGSGSAAITPTGVLTGLSAGTVTVYAAAEDGTGIIASAEVTIVPRQPIILVTNIAVSGGSGATTLKLKANLQMVALVQPTNATLRDVVWSVVYGTGQARIDAGGILTGTRAGTVTVIATAKDGSGVTGSIVITVLR